MEKELNSSKVVLNMSLHITLASEVNGGVGVRSNFSLCATNLYEINLTL